jgi:hypothetical protein
MSQLAALLSLLSGHWLLLLGPVQQTGPSHLVAGTAVATLALAVCLALVRSGLARVAGVTRHETRAAALRRRARRIAVVPQRDPDARGRTRPRAPTFDRRAWGLLVPSAGLLAPGA